LLLGLERDVLEVLQPIGQVGLVGVRIPRLAMRRVGVLEVVRWLPEESWIGRGGAVPTATSGSSTGTP